MALSSLLHLSTQAPGTILAMIPHRGFLGNKLRRPSATRQVECAPVHTRPAFSWSVGFPFGGMGLSHAFVRACLARAPAGQTDRRRLPLKFGDDLAVQCAFEFAQHATDRPGVDHALIPKNLDQHVAVRLYVTIVK